MKGSPRVSEGDSRLFFHQDIQGGVKTGKEENMAACLTELLCFPASRFIFLFSNKQFYSRLFLSSFFFFFYPASSLFIATSVFEMYLTEIKACKRFPLGGFFSPCSVCAFTPNNRTDKWRYLKSLLEKWHDRYSTSFHHNKTAMIAGYFQCVTFVVAHFCDPCRHPAFILAPF